MSVGIGEPLILADGTKIDPTNGKRIIDIVEVPSATQAINTIKRVHRTLADLPAPPKQMNIISAIISYSLVGLSDEDIAIALDITVKQVTVIKEQDIYRKMEENIVSNMMVSDADNIGNIIKAHSTTAINKIVALIGCKDEKIGLKAAQDVLDRGGFRPVDQVEHRMSVNGGLSIEFIRRDDTVIPTVQMTIDGEATDGRV